MGVIDSLSAGFRLLGRRLYLLAIPVLLDGLLWALPRLSTAPLFTRLAAFYSGLSATSELPPELADSIKQLAGMITQLGEGSNLLNGLATVPMLHVPSLLAALPPLAGATIRPVDNLAVAALLFLLFGVLGVGVGVAFLSGLAHVLPLGELGKATSGVAFALGVLRRWGQVLGFLLLAVLAGLALLVPTSLLVGVLTLISPAMGSVAVFLGSGLMFVLYFYLYFVVPGLVVDRISIWTAVRRSAMLVRRYFWAAFGFIFLSGGISLGFVLLFDNVATLHPLATAATILLNAYLGSGLAMALLVFYRTRLLRMEEETRGVVTADWAERLGRGERRG